MSVLQSSLGILLLTILSAPAATVFIDFGDSAQPTAGNYNNLTKGAVNLLTLANLVDSTGAPTGASVNVTGFHPGNNANGTTAPAGSATLFDAQATRDNFFGSTAVFGAAAAPTGTVTLGGLDASGNTAYSFDFFASRTGVGDNREAEYAVTGLTTASVYLDAANNASNIVSLASVIPTAGGTITINVDPGPNNTNSSGFFYLGAIRMTSTPVPEPAVSCTAVLAGLFLLNTRRKA